MRECLRRSAAALFLICWLPAAGAQFYGDKKYGEFYEEEKKWNELEAQLPAFPKQEDLIEFNAGGATSNRHHVDATTLTVGADGVVRYVAVVKTSGGATNISFEGIRCGTRERKLYAFGRTDGSWSPARAPSWQRIRHGSYQSLLYTDYFCPQHAILRKAEEGVDALKRGGHPEVHK
jgi:hypothetical protein